jgi:hypothetical protein
VSSSRLDLTKVVPEHDFLGENEHETKLARELYEEAVSFLVSHSWCAGIHQGFVGIAVGGVIGTFLFRIAPARADVDEWLWVVVGDAPPAYLVIDEASNPARALDAYIREMSEWVRAVRNGDPVDDVIPVLARGGSEVVDETVENADMLAGRLDFLAERILSEYSADLSS